MTQYPLQSFQGSDMLYLSIFIYILVTQKYGHRRVSTYPRVLYTQASRIPIRSRLNTTPRPMNSSRCRSSWEDTGWHPSSQTSTRLSTKCSLKWASLRPNYSPPLINDIYSTSSLWVTIESYILIYLYGTKRSLYVSMNQLLNYYVCVCVCMCVFMYLLMYIKIISK